MLTEKELRIVDVLWKSASIKETPGANIEDASGLNKAGQKLSVSMGTSGSNECNGANESCKRRHHFLESGEFLNRFIKHIETIMKCPIQTWGSTGRPSHPTPLTP